ncbi:unnamed protein product [Prorocentrum cordatum]|uniref:Uncharacterized protein n=1 Tax=Prorocentrum cordatum TaxID=2364126 RepID=A0ABN9UGD7_9DINO|nr:unnamed protein product [Polarella glacialis]
MGRGGRKKRKRHGGRGGGLSCPRGAAPWRAQHGWRLRASRHVKKAERPARDGRASPSALDTTRGKDTRNKGGGPSGAGEEEAAGAAAAAAFRAHSGTAMESGTPPNCASSMAARASRSAWSSTLRGPARMPVGPSPAGNRSRLRVMFFPERVSSGGLRMSIAVLITLPIQTEQSSDGGEVR